MPSRMTLWKRANPEKAKAYTQRNNAKHRAKMDASSKVSKRKRLAHRKELLSQFPCVCCGDPDDTVIQWHHVNPDEKEYTIWQCVMPEEDFWDEVLKCIPVCANCHIKIHKNKLCLIPPKLR